jgi:iron(III) transport system ATP-binding protein
MGWFSKIMHPEQRRKSVSAALSPNWSGDRRQGVSFASSLAFENISRSFGSTPVLDKVMLKLEPGDVMSLLGPSGSGKSTLLRIAAGFERPDEGCVRVNDREICSTTTFVEPERRGIGLIFQDFALFPHLDVLENVSFGLRQIRKNERPKVALAALDRVGLADKAQAWPHMLSGGEQQRVALARALAPRPSVVLMDEPFSGLDSRLRDSVRDQSLELIRETRASAILVTHDPEEAMRASDRICLLNDGKVVQTGTPGDLYNRPNSLFSARFFSRANLFSGKVAGGRLETVFGAVPATKLKDGQNAVLCVRDDGFDFTRSAEDGYVAGAIVDRRLLGSDEVLTVRVNGVDEPVSVRLPCHEVILGHRQIWLRPKLRQRLVFESAD